MLFKKFTDKIKERDRPIVRWRIGRGGDGDDEGGLPVKRHQASGDGNVIHDEMPSGPEAVFDGSLEIRHWMPFSVQRARERAEKGGMGERGGAVILKQEVNNEFRH